MKSFFQKLNANKSKKLAIALAVALVGHGTSPAAAVTDAVEEQLEQHAADAAGQPRQPVDARNTPTVRAAAAVGPSVVGITNKATSHDFFNNPVESQGVGSGVIFKNDTARATS